MRQQGKANTMKSVLTIGDGIGAWCLNYYLTKDPNNKVTQIYQNQFAKTCSMNSTAINCLRGTERGLSFLGDLLVDSHNEFEEFWGLEKPAGVFEGVERHYFRENHKNHTRFKNFKKTKSDVLKEHFDFYCEEKAYFISPQLLKNWFLKHSRGLNRLEAFVKEIRPEKNGYKIVTLDGEINADEIYLCSGQLSKSLLSGLDSKLDTYLSYSKPVAGTYLEVEMKEDLIRQKFEIENVINYDFEGEHLIINPKREQLMIGSTSDQTSMEIGNQEIFQIYNRVQNLTQFDLPPFEEWKIKTGIRFKGRKRTPFWGEVRPGLNVITGFYKNGFSFGFKAARDLVISQRTPF